MFITEQNGAQKYATMLKENFNVTDNEKLNWVSQYAAIHEIHESASLGINGGQVVPGQTGGVNPLYATPLNTTGMGDPAAPGAPVIGGTGDFFNQKPGSGDIPVSTLPMALNVALMTIGLELVPVIPAKGPWAMLSYMDFPYAGGKLNVAGNLTDLDGKGDGKDNKPIYVKFLGAGLTEAVKGWGLADNATVTATGNSVVFTGKFKGFSRGDGGLILETVKCLNGEIPASITEIFGSSVTFASTVGGVPKSFTVTSGAKADFVQAQFDFVDGFANFYDGGKRPMTRAQNETGTGNVIGLRLFSKWIEMGSYEVTGTVTRQQLQDLPLYGVDAVSKVMEAMQNEITQSINARILEHVFQLGVTNAVQQRVASGVDFNLHIGTADKPMSQFSIKEYRDIYGVDHKANWGNVKNAETNSSAENLHTRQRRISSRVLSAANLIQTVGRRGRATWIVTNVQVASALQDVSGYVVAPMANNMAQDGSQNLFLAGNLAGLKVYVDPYMAWDDTRICVGRKGNGNEPGVIFMPYILADTVSITAEGTMAPKMLVNSRYTIADAGFYPELQYYTFAINCDYDFV